MEILTNKVSGLFRFYWYNVIALNFADSIGIEEIQNRSENIMLYF